MTNADLLSIFAANFIGILLLLVLFICNFWRFRYNTYENKILITMIIVGLLSCIIIVVSYVVDGKEGFNYKFIGHVSNSYIFTANMFSAMLWMLLIETHIKCEPSTRKKAILAIPMLIGLIMVLVNLFVPCIYEIDSENVYHRKFLFNAILAIDILYMAYAVVICIITKSKGGIFRFFPVYLYIGPILLCLILEACIPNISLAWAGQAIAIASVLASLQNEVIYRDQLTGLYNRAYLNYIQKNLLSKDHCHVTGIMLDMNDFKLINDNYGHAKGDIALQQMARLLKEAVSDMGNVIRYAGDEFIVLINSHKQIIIDACITEINNCIQRFNDSNITEYKLTASMGYAKFNPKMQTIDDFMNVIDQKMYEDKKRYHHVND